MAREEGMKKTSRRGKRGRKKEEANEPKREQSGANDEVKKGDFWLRCSASSSSEESLAELPKRDFFWHSRPFMREEITFQELNLLS